MLSNRQFVIISSYMIQGEMKNYLQKLNSRKLKLIKFEGNVEEKIQREQFKVASPKEK